MPEIGLVTANCPTTLDHTADETSFVLDCKVKPGALFGHVTITLVPDAVMVSCGGLTDTDPNERLNTVP